MYRFKIYLNIFRVDYKPKKQRFLAIQVVQLAFQNPARRLASCLRLTFKERGHFLTEGSAEWILKVMIAVEFLFGTMKI